MTSEDKDCKFQVMLPLEIRIKILYFAFIGEKGPDTGTGIDIKTLNKCRRVSKGWSEMIKTNLWKRPSKAWGVITKAMINKTWFRVFGIGPVVYAGSVFPSLKMISHAKDLEARGILPTEVMEMVAERVRRRIVSGQPPDIATLKCAASFAHLGLMGPLKNYLGLDLRLFNVNLASVPTQHLAALVSCVKDNFSIDNISGCDLVSILNSVKISRLEINYLNLDNKETLALVQVMETGVEKVTLGDKMALDIEALTMYSGQGKCRHLFLWDLEDFREQLCAWAKCKDWSFKSDFNDSQTFIELMRDNQLPVLDW